MKFFIVFLAALAFLAFVKAQESTTESESSSERPIFAQRPFRFPIPFPIRRPFFPFGNGIFRRQVLLDLIQNNYFDKNPFISTTEGTTTAATTEAFF